MLPVRLLQSLGLLVLSFLVYQSSVCNEFQAVRVPLIDGARFPDGGVVRVALPSALVPRGTPLVLRGRLRNEESRTQLVRILLNGFPRLDVTLHSKASRRFAVTFSEGTERALRNESGTTHVIELRGVGDDWRLATLDAANVYAGTGGLLGVALVPARALPRPGVPGGVVLVVLVLLQVLALNSSGRFESPAPSRAYRAVTGLVLFGFGAALLLPWLSFYRILLQPATFWCAVLVLHAPAMAARALRASPALTAASRLPLAAAHTVVRATARSWQRHRTMLERACALVGLVALAVAQPLFDVVRASPEFFVARNTSATDAVGAVLIICAGLPLVLVVAERLLRFVRQGLATAFFAGVVGALVAFMVHPWLTRNAVAGQAASVLLAVAAGALVAFGVARSSMLRQCLIALVPAGIIVPALFFADPGIRGALAPPTARLVTPALARTSPIVIVVFDEFPVLSLLDAEGQIDAALYPNFAELARDGSWFSEASTVSSQTVWAVPAIVTGRYPTAVGAVPTLRYYPENLFTLLADRYEMFVFGRFLQLCPENTCHLDLGGPGEGPISLVADLAIVWLHIVTPETWAEGLPPVVGDWRGFARDRRWRTSGGKRVRNDRRTEFERFLSLIDGRSGRLYFLHTLTPHMPFEYVPSGRRYDAPDYQDHKEGGKGLFERASPGYADALHQRLLLQVGFVDGLIGRLLQRLRDLGIYDDTLLIVTADHGASYREGMPRRSAVRDNIADILRVPLLVKAPGQGIGGPSNRRVELVDILPTIADVLGMRLPFPVDGRSLLAADEFPRESWTFIDRNLTKVTRSEVTDLRTSSAASLARRLARFGSGSLSAFYTVPGTADLIGRQLDSLPRRAGKVRATLARPQDFAAVELSQQTLPLYVRGKLQVDLARPLAIVVNGRIAATTMPYSERGSTVFATLIPEDALREGRNDVGVFIVERKEGATTLVATNGG